MMRRFYPYAKEKDLLQHKQPLPAYVKLPVYILLPALLIYLVFRNSSPNTVMMLSGLTVILVAGGWTSIKDSMAGIFFRIENHVQKGDYIRLNDLSGRVQYLGVRCICLKSDDGPYVFIPYSTITKEIVIRFSAVEKTEPYTFSLIVPKKDTPVAMSEIVRNTVFNLIWVSLKTEPRIQFMEEQDNGYLFEVTVYPLISGFSEKIRDFVKKELA